MDTVPPELSTQLRVSRMLGYGFTLTLVTIGGLGSLVALLIGARALTLISRSGGALHGRRLAIWCVGVGALEVLFYIIHWLN